MVGDGNTVLIHLSRAQAGSRADKIPVNGLSRVAISALIIATIWFGVYPQPILDALKR